VHDEDRDILFAAQTVDGGRTGIARGCANDGQVLAVGARLVLIPAYEEVLEKVAQELEGHILERKRRTVEELEQVNVLGLVECDDWRDVLGSKGGITAVDDAFEVLGWDLGW